MAATLPWVVLKYGGTSVATAPNWQVIRRRVETLLPSSRVWVVVSALSKVTNLLLRAVEDAVNPVLTSRYEACDSIVSLHRALAADMGLSADELAPVEALLGELRRLLDGIVLTGEISPRLRARVAAFGELLSSQLGLAFLRKAGLNAVRVDPRTLLTSEPPDAAHSEADSFLEADVRPTRQIARANAAAQGAAVVSELGSGPSQSLAASTDQPDAFSLRLLLQSAAASSPPRRLARLAFWGAAAPTRRPRSSHPSSARAGALLLRC